MKRVSKQIKQSWVLWMTLGCVMFALGCEPGVQGSAQSENEYATQQSELFVLGGGATQGTTAKAAVQSGSASTKIVVPSVNPTPAVGISSKLSHSKVTQNGKIASLSAAFRVRAWRNPIVHSLMLCRGAPLFMLIVTIPSLTMFRLQKGGAPP